MSDVVQIVWFKRDLRIHDHAPLTRACASAAEDGSTVLCLYVFEPTVLESPDTAAQHVAFVIEALDELRIAIENRGGALVIAHGEMTEVLDALAERKTIDAIWSHEETGNDRTFRRDIAVGAWACKRGIAWHEFEQFGVVRRLTSRNGWAARWEAMMAEPVTVAPRSIAPARVDDRFPFLRAETQVFPEPDKPTRQRGGRSHAIAALKSFLAERGRTYQRGMSSPNSAPQVCSRLSPYLALGCVSMREVAQAARKAKATSPFPASLRSFDARLHWHCHFIQKLESEPAIEFQAFVAALDQIRCVDEHTQTRLLAWQQGQTGYPMVDACMRSLVVTGWLNFRMRAMLVSFAAYNLWIDWRLFAHFLARQFLDYEPGIHYSQLQMQSGVTGINTLRMYNPTKQAQEHDPEGVFIRKWCPELSRVPTAQLFEPWLLTEAEQNRYRVTIGMHYPTPIVDWKTSYKAARAAFAAFKNSDDVNEQADAVQEKHGSRKSGMKSTGVGRRRKTEPNVQDSLF